MSTTIVYAIGVTAVAALLAAIAQFLYKKGLHKFEFNAKGIMSVLTKKTVIAGLAVYFISFIAYIFALKMADLSIIYPTFSLSFVFTLAISHYAFKEKITAPIAAGVILVMLGIFLVAQAA